MSSDPPPEPERVVESRRIFEGRIVRLRVDTVAFPDGRSAQREVAEHAPVVVVVPLDGEGNVLMVRQYRLPVKQFLLELPAGLIDPGESVEEAVQRELREETGMRAGHLERLAEFYASPGFCDELMHLFLATELEFSPLAPDSDESVEVVRMPLSEALTLVDRGEIVDAKTIVGLRTVGTKTARRIAEDVVRQRLLMEGYYRIDVDEAAIERYFAGLSGALDLRMYGKPTIFSTGGQGKEENQGYDAFVPLVDSGISVYVWTNKRFVSIVLYTCKSFSAERAMAFTRDFFGMPDVVTQEF
jgi:ADP-ribose pyrophosphatase